MKKINEKDVVPWFLLALLVLFFVVMFYSLGFMAALLVLAYLTALAIFIAMPSMIVWFWNRFIAKEDVTSDEK